MGPAVEWAQAHFFVGGRMSQLECIREVVERVAASEGLEVVDVELHGRGRGAVLRVFLDKPGGVTHGDCQRVSEQVGTLLDVEDLVADSYTLEVSSPGLDRRLAKPADYERFAGRQVKLILRDAQDGRRRFQGRLLGIENGQVRVEVESGQVLRLAPDQIAKANLVPDFGNKIVARPPSERTEKTERTARMDLR